MIASLIKSPATLRPVHVHLALFAEPRAFFSRASPLLFTLRWRCSDGIALSCARCCISPPPCRSSFCPCHHVARPPAPYSVGSIEPWCFGGLEISWSWRRRPNKLNGNWINISRSWLSRLQVAKCHVAYVGSTLLSYLLFTHHICHLSLQKLDSVTRLHSENWESMECTICVVYMSQPWVKWL